MAPIGSQISMCPRKIRYTQDSIKGEFMDGTAMSDTLEELLYGHLSVEDMPLIEVVRVDGKWFALSGNRRLYLYKKLEELEVVHTIPVTKVSLDNDWVERQLERRMTTDCQGVAIRLRGNNQTDWHINQVINRWRSSQMNNRYANVASHSGQTERPGSQRGRSLERNSSNRANPSSEFTSPGVIHPPSIQQGSVPQRSKSIERGSTRSVAQGQRPNVLDLFLDGRNANSATGSVRSSSSNVRSGSSAVRDIPRPIPPDELDRCNFTRNGSLTSNGRAAGNGQNNLEPPVITSQPRRSTDPVMSSDESCCSCCRESCCCCCSCFPCCK